MTAASHLERATGLERARRRADGSAPLSPVHEMFDLRVTDVQSGSARARCGVRPWLVRSDGRVCPGITAVVADTALGTALLTTLPPGWSSVTRQLRLDHLAPIVGPPEEVTAVAHVEDAGGPMPLVVGAVYSAGVRVATASARCLTVPGHGEQPPDVSTHALVDVGSLGVLLRASAEPTADGVRVTCTSPSVFANVFGALHGGTVVLVAEQGLELAIEGAGLASATLADLQVTYVRPVPADGSSVVVDARVRGTSRRIADVEADLVVGSGIAVTVRATYLRADA